jgi:hypothetical protein
VEVAEGSHKRLVSDRHARGTILMRGLLSRIRGGFFAEECDSRQHRVWVQFGPDLGVCELLL